MEMDPKDKMLPGARQPREAQDDVPSLEGPTHRDPLDEDGANPEILKRPPPGRPAA